MEPATFRLVARYLNQLRYSMAPCQMITNKLERIWKHEDTYSETVLDCLYRWVSNPVHNFQAMRAQEGIKNWIQGVSNMKKEQGDRITTLPPFPPI
jgi:hypothetical protein